jgi:hypothetical protein
MHELPPKAAALLAAARRAHEPTAADGERVRAAVRASVALPLSHDLSAQSGAPGLSASVAPKALVPLLGKLVMLLSLLGGALWWIGAPAQRPTPGASARAQVATVPSAPAAEPETNTPVPSAAEPQRLAVTSAPQAQRASETFAAIEASAVRGAEPPGAESATPASELNANAERNTQRDRAGARPKPSAAPESERTAAREPQPAAPLPPSAHEELALMRAALGRLNAGDAAGALSLLDRHATQYQSGVMAQERVGLRAIALCAAGQVAAGSAEQQRFLSMASRSPLAPRVRAACQGQP